MTKPVFALQRDATNCDWCDLEVAPSDHYEEQEGTLSETVGPRVRKQRRSGVKPSCEACYFGKRMLCALELGGPCSTFRPDSPHGLVPPSQPMLLVEAAAAAALAA